MHINFFFLYFYIPYRYDLIGYDGIYRVDNRYCYSGGTRISWRGFTSASVGLFTPHYDRYLCNERLGLGVRDGLQCVFGEGDGAVAVGLEVDADVEVNTSVFSKVNVSQRPFKYFC